MNMQNNENKTASNGGYIIFWDRVIVAVAIFALIIIGCISMIMYFASSLKSNGLNTLTDKQVQGSTYADEPEADLIVEDVLTDYKVFIDAGHGGEDGGCTDLSETRLEKDDNLRISMAVKRELERMGVTVVTSRTDDTFVSLDDRCLMANESKADLFVSLHRNSAEDGQGVEIWVSNKEIYEDTLLGNNIMNALDKVGVTKNRGVQFGYIGKPTYNYQVNYGTDMPSCLVELGFITNDEDNEMYDKNFDAFAVAIAEAIYQTCEELNI
ncbi:MAG: N-acetylmuramoyl-L-alanine amidase [Ruminococcus sp.]|nr:N-acetylmuramoyl-L-alanine amidase [Ruminococcus sp.]